MDVGEQKIDENGDENWRKCTNMEYELMEMDENGVQVNKNGVKINRSEWKWIKMG